MLTTVFKYIFTYIDLFILNVLTYNHFLLLYGNIWDMNNLPPGIMTVLLILIGERNWNMVTSTLFKTCRFSQL